MANVTRKNHMSDEVFVITRGGETEALFPHAVSVTGGRLIFVSGQLALDKQVWIQAVRHLLGQTACIQTCSSRPVGT